jgi:hypothetical protein
VTAAVARVATPADSPLLAGYVAHLAPLGLSDRALRDRLGIARQFLGRHPDLQHWMRRPVTERVEQLRRTGAWPLVCY